ncbi:FUSC family protein [Actinorugispora endophytica]|uniref:Fusaric acid resistance family protein n=1 Tax=Actinorugispora endophytica TaxID=1605990 RepID=A0A4R6V3I0_9ACTN|nr:FUSC family protein [Actinorugispora endophytica]TDQ53107.1 fusaric acid resistance family protein [Actinorugispora endophytica]
MRNTRTLIHSGRLWAAATGSAVLERVSLNIGSVLLVTAAATVAWVIAVGLTPGHAPFFAPIAALVSLNSSGGERGVNAIRLLLGVVVGIPVGEVMGTVFGDGHLSLAAAAFIAMTVAVAIGAERMVIAQAAAGAILTVVIANGEYGLWRLTDALIGAGVALVTSQLLFPVRLVALLRRTEAAALAEMSRMLTLTEHMLEREQPLTREMINRLGELSQPMAELSSARESSQLAMRTSTIRWGDLRPILHEDEKIDRLILLAESCLSLARTTTSMSLDERRELAPAVRAMASALDVLAGDLSDRAARQYAVDQATEAARPFSDRVSADDPLTAATHLAVQLVAIDIMLFAGIEAEDAEEILRDESGEAEVTHPTAVPWLPWTAWRPRFPRGEGARPRRPRWRRGRG